MAAILVCAGLTAAGCLLWMHRPFWGLLGLTVLIPFDLALHVGGFTLYTNEAYLAGLALAILLRLQRRPETLPAFFKFAWPCLFFLLAVALSVLPADDKWAVFRQGLRWCEFFLAWIAACHGLNSRRQFWTVIGCLAVLGVVTSLIGLGQHFLKLPEPETVALGLDRMEQVQGVVRARATFGHANQFAGFLILLIPLMYAAMLEADSLRLQAMLGLTVLVLALALVMTYSRGAWLGAGLGLGLVSVYAFPKHKLKTAVLLSILLATLATLLLTRPDFRLRLNSFFSARNDAAVSGRIFYQKLALEVISRRPFLGYGAGNYPQAMAGIFRQYPKAVPYLSKHVHNLYSQIAIETGMVGLGAFLFFIMAMLARLARGFRHLDGADRIMVMAFFASILAFLCHNGFDVLTVYARGVHFALILGVGIFAAQKFEAGEQLNR